MCKLTACLCIIYVRLLIIYTSREGAAQLSVQTLPVCPTSKNRIKMSCNEKCINVWLKRCNKSTKARYAYTYLRFETPSAFINTKLISLCRRIYRKPNFMAISSRFFFAQSRLLNDKKKNERKDRSVHLPSCTKTINVCTTYASIYLMNVTYPVLY